MRRQLSIGFFAVVLFAVFALSIRAADSYSLHQFKRQQLSDVYYSEGANAGDLNRDGKMDIVYGPLWFEGPDFKVQHEIYPVKAQPREKYADHFFAWIHDFNGDGWNDVLTAGFPGTPAFVYENPKGEKPDKHWVKHQVFDQVANESPQFMNIVGDERPELICTHNGYWGYATLDWQNPWQPWQFHNVSPPNAPKPFGHGLGVGDVDGDKRLDILMKDGWYQQPASLEGDPQWTFHPHTFARAGGADMFAYDVDGDGDNDIITSLQAHEFGLAWYEQVADGDKRTFRQHVIMGSKPTDNAYGVLFSELHSVNLADMDGDGLKDIVTGKTYWSHHMQSPMWDAGAVVYWFRLVRKDKEVDWVPYQADSESGIGRQLIVADLNADKLPDLVAGGMKGCHVLIHGKQDVDREKYEAAQPRRKKPMADGLSPPDAAKQMTVPPGFHVQLAAGEPQVHQPVAFALDPRGRVWVAEAYTYPTRAAEGEGKDRIVILEDTNADGTLDQRKVFAQALNLVSGLELGFGGVWVGAAPYLMFIPDTNGDDVADSEPQILLDGFGFQDTHETLNSFIWGPDGWLYGCQGVFTHSRIGKPGLPDEQRTPMNAGIWRYQPQRHKFEVFAWGTSNPWGVDFNDHGQAFCTACVIPHLFHVIQGARYQRQAGQHFDPYVFDDIKTIADHAHYAGNIRDHAWWGHEPTELNVDTSAAGGGHAHCGAMIYLGGAWPTEYRNQIFFNNVHGNRVNNDLLEKNGSGFVGRHGKDLLMANDHWFRGINLKYGPDGNVYLIDWYDKNACHRVNPSIWDRTNGRVYKIVYGDAQPVKVDLGKLSDAELVALHTHTNQWYVRTARRLLQERGANQATHAALRKLFDEQDAVPDKLNALWTLHVTGGVTDEFATTLLKHTSDHVRAWTVQLRMEDRDASPEFLTALADLAKSDSSPVVRLYVSSALQRLPLTARWQIASALLTHSGDADDVNLPLMHWYAIEPLVAAEPDRALELAASSKIPLLAKFVLRRAASENGTLDHVVKNLAATDDEQTQLLILTEMLRAFEGRVDIPMPPSWEKAYGSLAKHASAEIRDRSLQIAVMLGDQRIFPRLREILASKSTEMPQRKRALEILVRGRDAQAAVALRAVLSEPPLRSAAIRALAAFDDSKTPSGILAVYDDLTDEEKRDAISTLVSRPSFAMALLDSVQSKQVPRTDLHAYHVRQLIGFSNADLTRRIKDVWGDIRATNKDKEQEIARLKKILAPTELARADLSHGRALFTKNCANCHVLFGEGTKVGPDITGSNRANLDYILENVVDPSAVLGKDYRMTVLVCADGRIVSGLIQKETDSAVTIRTINDTIVVPNADIDERKLSEQSLMPERLLDSLQPADIRDLVAYLGSPTQVSLRGPRSPIDPTTKRVPQALEGESLRVLKKSEGDIEGQKMNQFTKDKWSGNAQLWWTGIKPGAKLELAVNVAKEGSYVVELVMTKARDYGIAQLSIDDQKLGGPIDFYNAPEVITTGVLEFEGIQLKAGEHRLTVEIVGANPQAVKSHLFGLDYVRLRPH
jgi:putative membrane-bound dehydrogenase-like protein